jgi:hypothetical protein
MIRVIHPRRVKLALHVARIREVRIVYSILVREPERKRPFGRRKWKDNIKRNVYGNEIMWTGFLWLKIGSIASLL